MTRGLFAPGLQHPPGQLRIIDPAELPPVALAQMTAQDEGGNPAGVSDGTALFQGAQVGPLAFAQAGRVERQDEALTDRNHIRRQRMQMLKLLGTES